MAKIVLASGSPRRQELLQRIGITDFDIRVPRTEETYPAGLSPRETVEYISREKSDAAAALCTPEEIVIIKGLGSGIGALIVAFMIGAPFPALSTIPLILLLGFASYGLSVFFYVYAQRYLGAARTSAYYALSPFIGSFLSFIILHEQPTLMYGAALIVMIAGTILVTIDSASE